MNVLTAKNKLVRLEFKCTRNSSHKLLFFILVDNKTLTKIGQYPSLADLFAEEVNKYRKVLGDSQYKEFTRAIGLVSHGVGVGAFVYLRRIFENLIEAAHQNKSGTAGWDEEKYKNSRVGERIKLLADLLPAFMVENKELHAILSKGIHELSEEECLKYFPITQAGIELILDEKLEAKKREEKIKKATKGIGDAHQQLK